MLKAGNQIKDFRVEVKIRNNRIYSRVIKRWGSLSVCAMCTGLTYTTLLDYVGFKLNPITAPKGRYNPKFYNLIKGLPWKNSAVKIADTLGCDVLDLWPNDYFREVRNNRYFFEADKNDMLDLPIEDRKVLIPDSSVLPDSSILEGFDTTNLDLVLKTLEDRERRIIELRFGLNGNKNHTFREIANIESLSAEMIRQIEIKALRKLRHPWRTRMLRVGA